MHAEAPSANSRQPPQQSWQPDAQPQPQPQPEYTKTLISIPNQSEHAYLSHFAAAALGASSQQSRQQPWRPEWQPQPEYAKHHAAQGAAQPSAPPKEGYEPYYGAAAAAAAGSGSTSGSEGSSRGAGLALKWCRVTGCAGVCTALVKKRYILILQVLLSAMHNAADSLRISLVHYGSAGSVINPLCCVWLQAAAGAERRASHIPHFAPADAFSNFPVLCLAAGSSRGGAPAHFICPITHQLMFDPVLAADGFCFEASAIRKCALTFASDIVQKVFCICQIATQCSPRAAPDSRRRQSASALPLFEITPKVF